jgi:hypothetical protein
MLRRPAIFLLSLLVILSFGGILCAQAQAASAAGCCKSSCPKSQHRDPAKCCKINLAQSTAQVATTHQVTPDPIQMAVLSFAAPFFARLELTVVALEKIHPPPCPVPSPEQLCSLQI